MCFATWLLDLFRSVITYEKKKKKLWKVQKQDEKLNLSWKHRLYLNENVSTLSCFFFSLILCFLLTPNYSYITVYSRFVKFCSLYFSFQVFIFFIVYWYLIHHLHSSCDIFLQTFRPFCAMPDKLIFRVVQPLPVCRRHCGQRASQSTGGAVRHWWVMYGNGLQTDKTRYSSFLVF